MPNISFQRTALKAYVKEWSACFRGGHPVAEETLRACVEEARQLHAQRVITQPMAQAVETLSERMQAFLGALARGVRWFAPPPEWLLVWEMDELRRAIERPDLTEAARTAVLEEHRSSVEKILSEMGILNDAPGLRVEFARLISSLVDC